jgi:hypothetical protein
MRNWNLLFAVVFAFLALSLLGVAANVAADAQTARLLVEPEFGQLADQAWDSWRTSVLTFFRFLPF